MLIIDEANTLMEWEDKRSLDQLLAFFVYLTKQEPSGHQRHLSDAVAGLECAPYLCCCTYSAAALQPAAAAAATGDAAAREEFKAALRTWVALP